MTVVVEIPMKLPSASNMREHWAAKHRRVKAQREATRLVLKTKPIRWVSDASGRVAYAPMLAHWSVARLAITLTRVSPRKLDDDNLRGAFKACRDEVAAHFGVDDADPRIVWRYAQERGPACVRISFDVVTRSSNEVA